MFIASFVEVIQAVIRKQVCFLSHAYTGAGTNKEIWSSFRYKIKERWAKPSSHSSGKIGSYSYVDVSVFLSPSLFYWKEVQTLSFPVSFPFLSSLAKAKCNCMGTVHPVLFNCTSCGNIICTEEELEVCTYCGAFSRRYRQSHRGEEDGDLRKAIESKVGG